MQWNDTIKNEFTTNLGNQQYSLIMEPLYQLLEDSTYNTSVLSWIAQGAEAGHVPMMYLLLRNSYLTSKHAVLSEQEWQTVGLYILVSFCRVYQDYLCCKKFAHGRVHEWSVTGLFGYLSERITHALSMNDLLAVFLHKYDFWFAERIPEEKAPFKDALGCVDQWFKRDNLVLPAPVWVLYCSEKKPSKTKKIIFESSNQDQLNAYKNIIPSDTIKTIRAEALNGMLIRLAKVPSWFDFFSNGFTHE